MQTFDKQINSEWPSGLRQILQNRQLPDLQRIIRHAQRLLSINELLQQHLPADLAEYCHVMQFTPTELTIATNSAAWLTRLRYLQPELIQHLRQHPQLIHLNKIHLRISPSQTPKLHIPPPPRRISVDNRELLSSLAEGMTDPALQQALHKLAMGNKEQVTPA